MPGQPIRIERGLIGAEETAPNLATLQPLLTATVSGTHVELGWKWQGNRKFLDQLEIQVDRADGKGWVVLAFDTTPGYNDTAAFPATPTQWKYRAIYRVNDMQVGQWSGTVSVMVRKTKLLPVLRYFSDAFRRCSFHGSTGCRTDSHESGSGSWTKKAHQTL